MNKQFELGLVLGRFQHLHNGHVQMIDMARNLCEKTILLIGSAQESGTLRNPFDVEMREKIIKKVYDGQEDVVIGSLKDMTNENDICFEWGKYILENVEKMYGRKPDLMICGKDESRKGWFSEEDSQAFSELIVSREKLEISATELRQYLVDNRKEDWEKYVPEEIWYMYDEIREELMKFDYYRNEI